MNSKISKRSGLANLFRWRSLKTRVTLFTLAIFLVGIWSLALFASRMLHEDMQDLLSNQQFSTVSVLAGQVNQELDDRMRALKKLAQRLGPTMPGNTAAMQALLEQNPVLQTLFNSGIIPALDRFLEGDEGSAIYVNPLGVEVLGSARNVPVAGWFVGAILPTAEAFAPIRAMQQRMMLAAIILSLLAGGLAWWATWWMLKRQLSPMLEATRMLSTLSATNQPPQPLPITSQDEIGELIGGFEQLSSSHGGTGIGLAIMRRIVESCMGRAWIEEAPGGGCRLLFELPIGEEPH